MQEYVDGIFNFTTLNDDIIESLANEDTNNTGFFLTARKGAKLAEGMMDVDW